MGIRRQRQTRKPGKFLVTLFLFLLFAGGGYSFFLFFEGHKPIIDLDALPDYIGKTGTFTLQVTDQGSGIRKVLVTATQGEATKELYSASNPRLAYTGQIGPLEDSLSIAFDATELGFKDGPVQISTTVNDFSFRGMFKGNSVSMQKTVTLDTEPPRLRILHSERYISQGGTGIVIYTSSDQDSKHGVVVNGKFNAGHLVGDGRQDTHIAYFALPYNTETLHETKLTATDIAGNSTIVPFSTIFKKTRQKHDRINISDGFLSVKIPEFRQYYPDMPGDLLEQYLYTNSTVRQENNAAISAMCQSPSGERLWEGRFLRMPGSGRAAFADHRTYYYNGQPIDKQVHLGMDLASTRRADVSAANTGKVVFADYLGIYGNMILLDHGQGVFSLYSHLSQINVAVDDLVDKGDTIGLTGTSGMAGGDHLHFSMLINGVFANPVEWWDPHWIEVTITQPLTDSKF